MAEKATRPRQSALDALIEIYSDNTAAPSSKRLLRVLKQARKDKAALKQLEQDAQDMHDSCQTLFDRCRNCHRLHDANYICPFCTWDNSFGAPK